MQRVLILGGTAWLGSRIAKAWLAAGARVTCVARGASGSPPDGVAFVRVDRTSEGAYDSLAGEWDEIVELSYDHAMVCSALRALSDRARHWTLISSVSVYADIDRPQQDESAALLPPGTSDYGAEKVAAELATLEKVRPRLLIVRPGLIAGPGDPSDRFGYWPARLARGGRVLAPILAGRHSQAIHVDDLAAYVVRAGHERVCGVVNAVGESYRLGHVLATMARRAGFDNEFVVRGDHWLEEHGVRPWAGPHSLPLWLPAGCDGFATRCNRRFRATGGENRPLGDLIDQVLDDERTRGLDRPRRSGLTPDEEAQLLASF